MRVVLGELELMLGNNVGMFVKDDEPDRAWAISESTLSGVDGMY
jgi:hypothetical protein